MNLAPPAGGQPPIQLFSDSPLASLSADLKLRKIVLSPTTNKKPFEVRLSDPGAKWLDESKDGLQVGKENWQIIGTRNSRPRGSAIQALARHARVEGLKFAEEREAMQAQIQTLTAQNEALRREAKQANAQKRQSSKFMLKV